MSNRDWWKGIAIAGIWFALAIMTIQAPEVAKEAIGVAGVASVLIAIFG